MVISEYNEQLDPYFSARQIIEKFDVLLSVFGEKITQPEFKHARELFGGAVTALGAYELSEENKYYVQLNKQNSSFDVMGAKRTKQTDGSVLLELTQMEITELEEHFKTGDIIEFLKATKLSPRKSYNDKTMIVCVVNRLVSYNHKEIGRRIAEIKPKSSVFITGRVDGVVGEPQGSFVIFQAWSLLTKPLQFNVNETMQKFELQSPITLRLDMQDKMEPANLGKISIFDIFGLDEEKIKKKYERELKRMIPKSEV